MTIDDVLELIEKIPHAEPCQTNSVKRIVYVFGNGGKPASIRYEGYSVHEVLLRSGD